MFGFSKFQPGTGRKHFVSSRQMGIEEDSGFVVTRRCPLFTLNVAKILDFSKVANMVRFCLLIQRKCQIRPCPSSKVNTWNHKIWASFNIGSLCSLLIFSQYFPIICIKLGPISFIEQVLSPSLFRWSGNQGQFWENPIFGRWVALLCVQMSKCWENQPKCEFWKGFKTGNQGLFWDKESEDCFYKISNAISMKNCKRIFLFIKMDLF